MKKSLLALALFAFVGSASAHTGPGSDGKSGKKAAANSHCTGLGTPGCCMKKGAKTSAATDAKAPMKAM